MGQVRLDVARNLLKTVSRRKGLGGAELYGSKFSVNFRNTEQYTLLLGLHLFNCFASAILNDMLSLEFTIQSMLLYAVNTYNGMHRAGNPQHSLAHMPCTWEHIEKHHLYREFLSYPSFLSA